MAAQHGEFIALLRHWDQQEVLDARDAVEALLKSDGWKVVVKLLEEARDAIQGQMQYGKVLEQAAYTRELGRIVGMEYAVAAPEAVLIKADRIDKEAELELGVAE